MTTLMDRSEIWWADLPPPVGRRPVLILTRSAAVAVRNQVVVAQITTTMHNLPSEVRLSKTDGMPKECVVNCDNILTVPKNRLSSRIVRLTPAKMSEVNGALKFAMDIS
jgi:mRNA interferase MazF